MSTIALSSSFLLTGTDGALSWNTGVLSSEMQFRNKIYSIDPYSTIRQKSEIALDDRSRANDGAALCEGVKFTTFPYNESDGGRRPQKLRN